VIGLFTAAGRIQSILDSQGWQFCFIGGVALQHWGEPRVTRDLDIAVFTGFGGEAVVTEYLLSAFQSRVSDARQFALENRVLLLSFPEGPDIDVVLAALPFEAEMMARSLMVELMPGVSLRISSCEDLFVMKAFADRPQDRADVIGIARRRGRELDWDAVVERLTPLANAKDAPHLVAQVRALRAEFAS
jgi:hypothetical protein